MEITFISFNLPIQEGQIPDFRQAILKIPGLDHIFYNNKINEGDGPGKNINAYPRIHYRVHNKLASLWAINDGALELEKDIKKNRFSSLFWEGRTRSIEIVKHFTNLSAAASYSGASRYVTYRLQDYLPFSNRKKDDGNGGTVLDEYKSGKDFHSKLDVLERVIISHLVLFSYAAAWELKPRQLLKAKIVDILSISEGVYKKHDPQKAKHYIKFDLIIKLNADLPVGVSIGNHTSWGYGVLEKLEE